jgi:uncharacterized protein
LSLTDPQILDRLRDLVAGMDSVVVGFSGGIDSTLVLKVALMALGSDQVVAVTTVSPSYPEAEQRLAGDLARQMGSEHLLVESGEMEDPRYRRNDNLRCYFCKGELFRILESVRDRKGFRSIAYGANRDDLSDQRPGMDAAREAGIRAPLLEAGMGKDEVRRLGRFLGLPNWDKPARACLSSRIPPGVSIDAAALRQVEQAEDFLMARGLRQVRVRHHGEVARIEAEPAEIARLLDGSLRREVTAALQRLGFRFVAVDLEGYRQGSLNPGGEPGSGTG